MKLSVIIPNYNGYRFLPGCLSSLKHQTFTEFEVIIIDNGSKDSSISVINEIYPAARIVSLPKNTGFSYAVNRGILASESTYIMLLNNDTILSPTCLERLLYYMEADSSIFSCGADILSQKSPHLIDTTGDYYSVMGYAFCRNQGLPYNSSCLHSHSVFTNCACACMYRRSMFSTVGMFDEHFFAYLEDVDIGIRARQLGFSNKHCPGAIVYHLGSGTTNTKYSKFKVFYSARNNIFLQSKNLTLLQRITHLPFQAAGMLLKYMFFHAYGLERVYLQGCMEGIKNQASFKVKKRRPLNSIKSYIRTEPWILLGTVLYIAQYLKRRLTN